MYNKIVNPITGRKVLINGELGRKILKNYIYKLSEQQGGGAKWDFSRKIWTTYQSGPSAEYSKIEADILNQLGIKPLNRDYKIINLLNNPDYNINFNKSVNKALTEQSSDSLIIIVNLAIDAADIRLKDQDRFKMVCSRHLNFIQVLLSFIFSVIRKAEHKSQLQQTFKRNCNKLKTIDLFLKSCGSTKLKIMEGHNCLGLYKDYETIPKPKEDHNCFGLY